MDPLPALVAGRKLSLGGEPPRKEVPHAHTE